mmetsp:Transcript_52351/g.93941  ORF Transcript_52351/g.93941 Transcript_52351/m.93941 type:complete len:390 (+) Transcript_52351:1556-2725(+)
MGSKELSALFTLSSDGAVPAKTAATFSMSASTASMLSPRSESSCFIAIFWLYSCRTFLYGLSFFCKPRSLFFSGAMSSRSTCCCSCGRLFEARTCVSMSRRALTRPSCALSALTCRFSIAFCSSMDSSTISTSMGACVFFDCSAEAMTASSASAACCRVFSTSGSKLSTALAFCSSRFCCAKLSSFFMALARASLTRARTNCSRGPNALSASSVVDESIFVRKMSTCLATTFSILVTAASLSSSRSKSSCVPRSSTSCFSTSSDVSKASFAFASTPATLSVECFISSSSDISSSMAASSSMSISSAGSCMPASSTLVETSTPASIKTSSSVSPQTASLCAVLPQRSRREKNSLSAIFCTSGAYARAFSTFSFTRLVAMVSNVFARLASA